MDTESPSLHDGQAVQTISVLVWRSHAFELRDVFDPFGHLIGEVCRRDEDERPVSQKRRVFEGDPKPPAR